MFWWLPSGPKEDNVSQEKGEAKKKTAPKAKKKAAKSSTKKKPAKKISTASKTKASSKSTSTKGVSKKKASTQKKGDTKTIAKPKTKAVKKPVKKETVSSEEAGKVSWTDERVNTLKKLWSEGKSASEIAEELGDITRNAVIGKAHRLGLSGRPSPIKKTVKKAAPKTKKKAASKETKKQSTDKSAEKTAKKPKATKDKKPSSPAPAKSSAKESLNGSKSSEKEAPVIPTVALRPEPKINPEDLVDLLDLTERMCRWPVGDPKEGVFGFCGAPCDGSFPYCKDHITLAYQTSTKKGDKRIKKFVPVKVLDEDDNDDDDIDEEDLEDIDDIDPDDIDNMDDDDDDDIDDDDL